MSEETKQKKAYSFISNLMKNWGLGETLTKVLAGALIGVLAALGFLSSCQNITNEQIQNAHDLYHAISDKPCIFEVEETEK